MKKHLRLLCIVLTLVMCVSALLACGGNTDLGEPIPTLTITDDFVITRSASATENEIVATNKIFIACQNANLNVTVSVDNAIEIPKNEILIGQTNRSQSAEAHEGLGSRDYTIKLTGDAEKGYKIIIAAVEEKGMTAAVDYFIENYLSGENACKVPLDLLHNYQHDYPCEDVKIAGTPVGDYQLVYAKEGVTSPTDPHYNTFIQTAKYKDTAEAIADMIEEASGMRPEVIPDSEAVDDGTPKILFGKTDLEGDDFAYTSTFAETGSYTGKLLDNGTVVLAGDNACAVYAAGEAFYTALCEAKTDLTAFEVADTKKLIKVACIGDSITHGTSSSDSSAYNYPVYLQRMLGYDYYVEKYGAPGYSLTSTDIYQYTSYSIYNSSLEAKPDVVLFMLGTNDCNPGDDYKDWSDPNRATTFMRSANTMISAYRRANRNVQIYMMTPPTVPQNETWATSVKENAVPLVKQIAETENCLLIDIHEWSLSHKSTFTADGGDGLHPKNEHYGELAEGVYEGLKDTIVKPE